MRKEYADGIPNVPIRQGLYVEPAPLDLSLGQKFRTARYVGTIIGLSKTVVVFRDSRPYSGRMAKRDVFEIGVREGMIEMIDRVESFDMGVEEL